MVRGHPCPHPGSEGHSSDPLASADLWSAGIPARIPVPEDTRVIRFPVPIYGPRASLPAWVGQSGQIPAITQLSPPANASPCTRDWRLSVREG